MKLQRFTQTERLFHWAFVLPMLLLAGSGMLIISTSVGIVSAFAKESLLFFHTCTGFGLIFLPLLVYLLGDRDAIWQNMREFFNFPSSDRRWLAMNFVSLIKSEVELPLAGKFNGGQKVNGMLTIGLIFTLCVSGFTMVVVKGALVANVFHGFAFTLFAMILPGHLYLALINPSTRPAFMGIITGYVEAAWLEHHHFLMFQKVEKTIFADIIVDHAKNKELNMIYEKVYKGIISPSDFSRLCHHSEAMLVARKNNIPVSFMQIVGDGCLQGYIAKSANFSTTTEENDFSHKFTAAAEALIKHPLFQS